MIFTLLFDSFQEKRANVYLRTKVIFSYNLSYKQILMTRKGLNYVGFADLVNKSFGMPTIHDKQVGMERPTLSELSSVLTERLKNAFWKLFITISLKWTFSLISENNETPVVNCTLISSGRVLYRHNNYCLIMIAPSLYFFALFLF